MEKAKGKLPAAVRALLAVVLAVGLCPVAPAGAQEASAQQDASTAEGRAATEFDYAEGSIGFFEHIGATAAVNAIKSSPGEEIVGGYQRFDNMDSTDSAFNLDNMRKSISIMEECNDLRAQDGLPPLRVDPLLIAQGQVNANYSKGVFDSTRSLRHSGAYNMGENLAALTNDPFSLWYTAEKRIWESAEMSEVRAYYEQQLDSAGVNALYYLSSSKYKNEYHEVGHYLNIVYPHYGYTGAAWAGSLSQQSFGFRPSSDETYTVSEFASLFQDYYEKATANRPVDPGTEPGEPGGGQEGDEPSQGESHRVNVFQPSHGTITASKQSALPGETVRITAVEEDGYEVTGVIVYAMSTHERVAVTPAGESAWTFAMPDDGVTVQADISAPSYTVNIAPSPNGDVAFDKDTAAEGDTVRVTVRPDAGYQVANVSVTTRQTGKSVRVVPEGGNVWTFTMPGENVKVSVSYEKAELLEHAVSVAYGSHMTASASPQRAKAGDTVTVTARADEGYRVGQVSVRSAGAVPLDVGLRQTGEATWTFTMPDQDAYVVAMADEDDQTAFDVTVQQPAHAYLSVSSRTARLGDTVTVRPTANEGWKVLRVTAREQDGSYVAVRSSSDGTWSFAMPAAPVTVSATVAQDGAQPLEVKVSAPDHATLETVPADPVEGELVTVIPHPEDGWKVDSVSVTEDGGSPVRASKQPDGTWTFAMPGSDVTVTARTVEEERFTVALSQPEHATIACDVAQAERGQEVTVTVRPEDGWKVESVAAQYASSAGGTVNYMARPNGDGTWTFYMPAGDVTVVATLAEGEEPAWSCDGGLACPTHAFADVDHAGGWYHREVDWAVESGVMSGYANAPVPTFGPDDPLNRAQMATILHNLANKPYANPAIVSQFSDCSAAEWYATAVAWSVSEGVFGGYGGTSLFGPLDDISREQMAVVLWRDAGEPHGTGSLAGFPDGDAVSPWARDAMEWAVGEGLIQGYGNTGRLEPGASLTRAQAATIIMRWVEG